jgi:hypothetical protein
MGIIPYSMAKKGINNSIRKVDSKFEQRPRFYSRFLKCCADVDFGRWRMEGGGRWRFNLRSLRHAVCGLSRSQSSSDLCLA